MFRGNQLIFPESWGAPNKNVLKIFGGQRPRLIALLQKRRNLLEKMANAVLNHRILPQRFISQSPPRVSHSINLKLLEARRQFHPLFPPLLSTHTNLPCRRRRRSSGVASCLHSSSSSPPRTGLNSSTRLFVSGQFSLSLSLQFRCLISVYLVETLMWRVNSIMSND